MIHPSAEAEIAASNKGDGDASHKEGIQDDIEGKLSPAPYRSQW